MTAGYSGTPLVRKLGIAADADVAFVNAPGTFEQLLAPLPEGVRVRSRLAAELDVIVAFARRRAELERRFAACAAALAQTGGLWIAWPKRSSGVDTDLTENVVREIGLAHGLVDNKVCAIDETWSGLRFVIRRSDRV